MRKVCIFILCMLLSLPFMTACVAMLPVTEVEITTQQAGTEPVTEVVTGTQPEAETQVEIETEAETETAEEITTYGELHFPESDN